MTYNMSSGMLNHTQASKDMLCYLLLYSDVQSDAKNTNRYLWQLPVCVIREVSNSERHRNVTTASDVV